VLLHPNMAEVTATQAANPMLALPPKRTGPKRPTPVATAVELAPKDQGTLEIDRRTRISS
jgi:hypothetical protein